MKKNFCNYNVNLRNELKKRILILYYLKLNNCIVFIL